MSKKSNVEICEITVRGKLLQKVQNITVSNTKFSAELSKYITTWMAIELENYQALHGPVPKSETYQTYADTQSAPKSGRKIQQTKKDKKDGTEKVTEVSPKAFFTNLGNLKIFLNYFLIKYVMELNHIFIANDREFDRNYNEEELEKDALNIVSNPLIPFVLHVAKKFDSNGDHEVQFEGMNSIKQIFKGEDNGQASTKKIDQFVKKFFEFVNVIIIQVFTISFPHKALLHIENVIGIVHLLNKTADTATLGEDVLQDLNHYLGAIIKKPVKTAGKKTGKKTTAKANKEEEEEEPAQADSDSEIADNDEAYSEL